MNHIIFRNLISNFAFQNNNKELKFLVTNALTTIWLFDESFYLVLNFKYFIEKDNDFIRDLLFLYNQRLCQMKRGLNLFWFIKTVMECLFLFCYFVVSATIYRL